MNCPICNKELHSSDTFCPECGFELQVLPDTASIEVKELEKRRVQKYRESLEKLKKDIQKLESSATRLSNENSSLQEKRKTLEKQLSDEKDKTAQLERDLNDAQQKADNNTTEIERLTKVQTQLKSEKEKTERKFKDEQEAHDRTRQEVKRLQGLLTNPQPIPQPQPQPQSQPRPQSQPQPKHPSTSKPKATINIMGSNGTRSLDVFDGENIFSSPQDINFSTIGVLFRITIKDDICTLYDICGETKKANGRKVRSQGDLLFDGDIFMLGTVECTFNIR